MTMTDETRAIRVVDADAHLTEIVLRPDNS